MRWLEAGIGAAGGFFSMKMITGETGEPRGRGISSWHSRRGETERISRVSEGICFPAVSQHVLEGGGAGSEGIPGHRLNKQQN